MTARLDSLLPAARPLSTIWRAWRAGRAAKATISPRSTPRFLDLPRNRVVALPALPGETVECFEGSLWITFDDDPRDVVVEAGRSFVVDRDGRGMIQALADSRLRVTAPAGLSAR